VWIYQLQSLCYSDFKLATDIVCMEIKYEILVEYIILYSKKALYNNWYKYNRIDCGIMSNADCRWPAVYIEWNWFTYIDRNWRNFFTFNVPVSISMRRPSMTTFSKSIAMIILVCLNVSEIVNVHGTQSLAKLIMRDNHLVEKTGQRRRVSSWLDV